MNTVQKLTKGIEALNPYIAAAGSGAALGASLSDDRKKGAMKGALIGLGGLASGKLLGSVSNAIIRRVFGSKLKDAETFIALQKAGKSKREIAEWLLSKGYDSKDIKELGSVNFKATMVRGISTSLAPSLGLAGAAYALKNDPNNKKR